MSRARTRHVYPLLLTSSLPVTAVTCSEGCQFCRECARGNAANEIGLRKYVLKCMSTDGCSATFPESELVKCLSSKTLGALHKIKQEKEVDEAAIEGLVKCPWVSLAISRLRDAAPEPCSHRDADSARTP